MTATSDEQTNAAGAKTVLCAVDFSALSTRELDVAVEMAGVLGGRLVVVHHCNDVPPTVASAWDWRRGDAGDDASYREATKRLSSALQRIAGRVPMDAILATGSLAAALDRLVDELPADLLLLGNHGASTPERPSFTERAIARASTAVLVVHDDDVNGTSFHLRRGSDDPLPRVLVPLDFREATSATIGWVRAFACAVPLDLHLLHVLPIAPTLARVTITGRTPADLVDDARDRLRSLLPDDVAGRVTCSAELGDPPAAIAAYADRIGPDLMVMGQHTRDPIASLASRDTARHLLHRAWCPVLFVPGA